VGRKETSGRGEIPLRGRYVDRVEFPTRKRDKWKRCNFSQSEAVCKYAVCKLLCANVLCVNCCVQKRREVSDVGYSQNCG
jgi:hypothetical protein